MVKICALLLLSCPLFILVGDASAQQGAEVKKTKFDGNAMLSDDQLKRRLELRRTSTIELLAAGEDEYTYTPENAAADSATLVQFYQREGFLHVSVSSPRVIPDGKDEVILSFTINEGEPVTVANLELIWDDSALLADTLRDSLAALYSRSGHLQVGQRFRDSLVLMDRGFLGAELAKRGYPYRQIAESLEVTADREWVNVFWRILPGRKMYFDEVFITGNERVAEPVIMRQVPIGQGDLFSPEALEETQKHIYTLSMFRIVTVRPLLTQAEDSLVDVEILVDESPRLNAKVGVGYGAEEEFRVFTDTRYLGFLGGARQLSIDAKHSALEPYSLATALTQPAFPDRASTFTFGPYIRRQEEPAYTATRLGITAVVSRPLMQYVNGVASYLFEDVRLDISSLADSSVLDTLVAGRYRKSSISLGVTFDNAEPPITPTEGMFITTGVTFSGLGLGSDYHFIKTFVDVRRYQPLRILDIGLGTRFKIGGIEPTGDNQFIPIEERFYAGGATSIRGWGRHELGEQLSGKPVGGNSVLETSLELRVPAFAKISVAAFVDAGNVWRTSYHFDLSDLRYAAGTGLRYSTPIGPVRLDFARPIWDDEKRSWEVHLSIGEAF